MPISEEQIAQLQQLTQTKLDKMFLDKKQTPKLLIPKSLPTFIKTPLYRKFLLAVYEYCSSFSQIIKQYNHLSIKLGNNNLSYQFSGSQTQKNNQMEPQRGIQVKLLQSQKQVLGKLQREVSYCYSQIILSFNMQCMKFDGKRSNFKDQVFFEALIYLVERVLKQMYTRQQFLLVQEQIHRLFRTNRYNLIKKRHENDQILQKYPALKQQKQKHKNNLTSILSKAPQRIAAYKKLQKQKKSPNHSISYDYTQTLGIPKQLHNPDLQQRSPLLCTWLPSKKTMVHDLTLTNDKQNYLQAINYRSRRQISRINQSEYSDNNQQQTEGRRNKNRLANVGRHMMSNQREYKSDRKLIDDSL